MATLAACGVGAKLVALGMPGRVDRGVELDDTIRALIAANAAVAIAVSGGKDSVAAALAVIAYLDADGHTGPRILIHADLGDPDPRFDVEWADSLPTCERLAKRLGLELLVTRRAAGGMMKRWLKRQENNVTRYIELSCVRMILPWSTPAMRFCTSELKSAPMASALRKRFPGQAPDIRHGVHARRSVDVALGRADDDRADALEGRCSRDPARLALAGDLDAECAGHACRPVQILQRARRCTRRAADLARSMQVALTRAHISRNVGRDLGTTE